MRVSTRTLFLLVSVSVLSVTVALRPVSISKCCGMTEILSAENKCVRNESSSWNLRIYNGRESKFIVYQTLPSHWKIRESVMPNCSKPVKLSFESQNHVPFFNGSLFSAEYDEFFHPENYCLDYFAALVCRKPQQFTHVTIKKCCGKNAIYSHADSSCKHFRGDTYKIDVGQDKMLGTGIAFPVCTDNKMHIVGSFNKSNLMANGSLLVDSTFLLPVGNYCVENVLDQSGHSGSVFTCSEYLPSQVHIQMTTDSEYDLRFKLYPIGLALSVIFLAATLAAGSLLPASHHVLHWRCQTNHVACLLLGDALLCITHLSGNIAYVPCFCIAVAMHFLFLAAFFWLNTMCFNIWWTFRDFRPQNTDKKQDWIRLKLYEAYAWGIPLLISITAILLDLNHKDNPESTVLRPRFAEATCWFYGRIEKLAFFFGPVGTLLFINLLLFILTARELTCGLWKRELVKSTTERAALGRVCMKLVVVMGISWIMDLISFVAGGPKEVWYVPDMINSIHGVFIFIVVGCQPQVLSAVKRLWCLRHRQDGRGGTTNHHSSSSQGLPSMGDTLTNTNSVTNGTTKSVPLETSC